MKLRGREMMDKMKLLKDIFHEELYRGEMEKESLASLVPHVDKAIASLAEHHQLIEIITRRYSGETLKHVAEQIGSHASTVRIKQHRAIKLLWHKSRKKIWFPEEEKETDPKIENKEIQLLLETGSVTFVGHYRRDLEKTNWHYYETTDGDLLHFRKDKMLAVLERPSFNNIVVNK